MFRLTTPRSQTNIEGSQKIRWRQEPGRRNWSRGHWLLLIGFLSLLPYTAHGLRPRLAGGSDGHQNAEISHWHTSSSLGQHQVSRLFLLPVWDSHENFNFFRSIASIIWELKEVHVFLECFHFCQESHSGKRIKAEAWCHAGDLVSWKNTYVLLAAFQVTSGENGAQEMIMGEPQLD